MAYDGLFSSEDISDSLFTVSNTVLTSTTTTTTTATTDDGFLDREILGVKVWVWTIGWSTVLAIVLVIVVLKRRGGQ